MGKKHIEGHESPTREGLFMGIGTSIFLIAVGAILRWAVDVNVEGINLDILGLILLVIGVGGLILSLVFWSSLGSWYPGRSVTREDRVVTRDRYRDDDIDRAA